jgi:N-dimethylarginine dimethylaminohydrolase
MANVAFIDARYDRDMPTRFLVCPPTHYAIVYDINPWMTRNVGYAAPEARRQWERFIETLLCAGDVELVEVEANQNVPDLVFTGSAGLVCGNLAIVSSFRHPERRLEQSLFRAALARAGLATTYLRQTYFEGAGDALFDRLRPLCYAGYGWRTERSATLQLQEIVGCRVMPLLLVDERFFHLDTALCPLGSGHVMVHFDAFSPHAQQLLRRAIDPGYIIEVGLDDALALACNAVEVGDALVMHSASRALRERLQFAGYRVFTTELDEFIRAGGSARGLTLRLDDGPAVAAGVEPEALRAV